MDFEYRRFSKPWKNFGVVLFYPFDIYGINSSMKEMVEKVLSEEERARELVNQAREEAGEKTREAQEEASRILDEARQEGQQLIRDAQQEARRRAEERFEAAMRQADEEAGRLKQEKAVTLDGTVKEVVDFLITPAYRH